MFLKDCFVFIYRLLGTLSFYVSQPLDGVVYPPGIESPVDCYAKLLLFHLKSKSAIQRFTISLVLLEWAASEVRFILRFCRERDKEPMKRSPFEKLLPVFFSCACVF